MIAFSKEMSPSEMAICRAWVTEFSPEKPNGVGAASGTERGRVFTGTGTEATEKGDRDPESTAGEGAESRGEGFAGVAGEGATDTAFSIGAARIGRGTTGADKVVVEFV